jgi:hypothetical protein
MVKCTLEGDLVALANHLNGPIVVAITAGRPLSAAVNVVVGESNTSALVAAKNIMLATQERCLGRSVIVWLVKEVRHTVQ